MTQQRPLFSPNPVTLNTEEITLRPLSVNDAEDFYRAGNYAELWQWVTPNRCQSIDATKDWIEYSLDQQQKGLHLAFVIVDNRSQQIIGSTRYCSIRAQDRNLEIGFTFISPQFQRSHVNSQAKFLLLQHAFEQLGAVRVEFKTHQDNMKSRNAISRIGATFEGILRNLRILADGSLRNTALFSITEQEWPEVKAALQSSQIRY